jgi:hypothetical protein
VRGIGTRRATENTSVLLGVVHIFQQRCVPYKEHTPTPLCLLSSIPTFLRSPAQSSTSPSPSSTLDPTFLTKTTMLSSLFIFTLLAASSSAAPVPAPVTPTAVLAYNVALPGPTPAYQKLASAALLPYANVTNLLGAVSGGTFPPTSPSKRQIPASTNSTSASAVTGAPVTCLDSTYSELRKSRFLRSSFAQR